MCIKDKWDNLNKSYLTDNIYHLIFLTISESDSNIVKLIIESTRFV